MSARPGRVSSWFSAFAARPTSSAPESRRVARKPTSGMPTSLRTPVVAPAPRWRAEAALGAAPEVVGEPDRGDRRHAGRPRDAGHPADEREPRPRWLTRLRAAGERGVEELAAAVDEAAEITAGCAMRRGDRPRGRQARLHRVDRHPRLAAEPGREREARRARRRERKRCPESGSRGVEAAPQPDQGAARARFAIPKPPPCARSNAATARSASALEERR